MVNSELNVKPFRWFIYQNVKLRATLKTGTIERWNGGMAEWRNGGMADWWKMTPKSLNTERRKMTPNPKTRNGGKCPQILKHGTDIMFFFKMFFQLIFLIIKLNFLKPWPT